ncbi:MAG: hypothetical protein H7Z12_13980 [Rhodospirillaceae bacterium]|nr:hypothetical protein [Rhodospirillales bacterium]
MDEVEQLISVKFQNRPPACAALIELWQEFKSSGLADNIFVPEITSGDDGKFWSRVWEMNLHRELVRAGHQPASADCGPDFGIMLSGRRMWFEAVCPSPMQIDENWLQRPPGKVWSFPHSEITLRLTSAIRDKSKKFDDYRTKGWVGSDDAYVICVCSGRLLAGDPLLANDIDNFGVSGAPLIGEAVLPIGPWAVSVKEGGHMGESFRSSRTNILKHNGEPIPTTMFLDPAFAGVSAVLCSASLHPTRDWQPLIVHNPLARAPLPTGLFPGALEYMAEVDGEWLNVKRAGDGGRAENG